MRPDQQLGRIFSLQSSASEAETDFTVQDAVIATKVNKGLLWKFVVLGILCYIDRSSLAFASPQLTADLNFSEVEYGLGAGLFFVGYIIFQVCDCLLGLFVYGTPYNSVHNSLLQLSEKFTG